MINWGLPSYLSWKISYLVFLKHSFSLIFRYFTGPLKMAKMTWNSLKKWGFWHVHKIHKFWRKSTFQKNFLANFAWSFELAKENWQKVAKNWSNVVFKNRTISESYYKFFVLYPNISVVDLENWKFFPKIFGLQIISEVL